MNNIDVWLCQYISVRRCIFVNKFVIIGNHVVQIKPIIRSICIFSNFGHDSGLIGDYCEFLNNKYMDKNINQEWPPINIQERIKWHKQQIKLLETKGNLRWNIDGYGVE